MANNSHLIMLIAGYYKTCARVCSYKEQVTPKNYCFEHTKQIFNEYNLLNLRNLYVHQTAMDMFKVMKDNTPISVYDMFNLGQRSNLRVNLPSIQLNVSRYIC